MENARTAAKPPLILASTSPRRRELIQQLGIPCNPVAAPGVEELSQETAPALLPAELALANAMRKAFAAAGTQVHAASAVLGADTIVVLGARILGKPRDLAEAAEFLRLLGGQTHTVLTALALFLPSRLHQSGNASSSHAGRRLCRTLVESTAVTFRPLSHSTIELYLQEVPVLDKAGAYALQHRPDLILDRVEGSSSNVIGLPMEGLRAMLEEAGLLHAKTSSS